MIAHALWLIFVCSLITAIVAWFAPSKNTMITEESHGEAVQPQYSLLPAPRDEIVEAYARLSETARCELVLALDDLTNVRAQRILDLAIEDPSEAVALAAAYVCGHKKLPFFAEILNEDFARDRGSNSRAVTA